MDGVEVERRARGSITGELLDRGQAQALQARSGSVQALMSWASCAGTGNALSCSWRGLG